MSESANPDFAAWPRPPRDAFPTLERYVTELEKYVGQVERAADTFRETADYYRPFGDINAIGKLIKRIEDLEDALSVYEAQGEPSVPWEEVKKKAGLNG